jgi:oleandomycin transport system ATP-binding protein
VLFLDEPTTGLDPRSRNDVWQMIREMVADGTTVLLTTQYLDEADQLADGIVVVDHGRVIAHGTTDELRAQIGQQTLDVWPIDPAHLDRAAAILAEVTGTAPVRNAEDSRVAVTVDDPALLSVVVRRLGEDGIAVRELAFRLPSLDEVFLMITTGRSPERTAT